MFSSGRNSPLCDQHVKYPAVAFIGQNYLFKSLAIKFVHVAALEPIPYTGRKLLSHSVSNQRRNPQLRVQSTILNPTESNN